MKKLLLIITIFIVLQACSSKTNYNSSKIIDAKAFNCEKMDVVSGSETVIIKAKDLKECIIKDNKKIVWLYFYYQNCPTQDINVQINQKKIFEKYKDKIDYIMVSETFDIKEVKKTEQAINHPIVFIDPSYDEKRIQNSKQFLTEVLLENTTSEALNHTNIFIYEGKVIGSAFTTDISNEFVEQLISKL